MKDGGNLGLGVTPSASTTPTIEVGYVGNALVGRSGVVNLTLNAYRTATWKYANSTGGVSNFELYNGGFDWYNATSGTAGTDISFALKMRLTAAGRLLLGTPTESTYLLDVNGTGRFSGTVKITTGTDGLDIGAQTGNSYRANAIFRGTTSGGSGVNGYTGVNVFSSDGSMDIAVSGSNALKFYPAGSLALTLASTGAATFSSSVTAGGALLVSYANARASINSTTATNSSYLTFGNTTTGYIGLDNSAGTDFGNGAYSLNLINGGAYNLNLGTSNTTRLAITSGGNVLVGTTTDYAGKLQVNGQLSIIKSSGYAWLNYTNITSNNQYSFLQNVTNGFLLSVGKNGTSAAPYLAFGVADGEHMRISTSGNLLIGTTTDSGYKLDVNGTGRFSNTLRIDKSITYGIYGPEGYNINAVNTSTSTSKAGNIAFLGYSGNGTSPYQWGIISGEKDSATGDGNYAGSLTFWTTSGGAGGEANSATYKRLTISGTGAATFSSSVTATSFNSNNFAALDGSYPTYFTYGEGGIIWQTGTTERMRLTAGNLVIGTVKTAAPSGGTAKPWKLGAYQTNTVVFDTAHYVQVEIDGVAYRLALAL
jgi:hypothetical protein